MVWCLESEYRRVYQYLIHALTNLEYKKQQLAKFIFQADQNVKFWAIFWQSNGNFPECQIYRTLLNVSNPYKPKDEKTTKCTKLNQRHSLEFKKKILKITDVRFKCNARKKKNSWKYHNSRVNCENTTWIIEFHLLKPDQQINQNVNSLFWLTTFSNHYKSFIAHDISGGQTEQTINNLHLSVYHLCHLLLLFTSHHCSYLCIIHRIKNNNLCYGVVII